MIFGPLWAIFVRFARILRRGWRDETFRGVLYLVTIVVAAGTVFYRIVEQWSVVDSLYFTVMTLTTVGYGDFAPTTAPSKVFTVFLVLVGVGVLVAFVERVATLAADDIAERRGRRHDG